ncbi:MAG: hypothetical protein KAQ88_12205 [Hyphomicrobiaceae bacterium]|nr:hypothetical protein [Hyphomicrobiaceae bacterium]
MRKLPKNLMPVPEEDWPKSSVERVAVWRSCDYLVQVFAEPDDMLRISMCRTTVRGDGRWEDGLSWDEMQRIKREIRLGDSWAVEIFPADDHIVNVANMRHLWVSPRAPDFGWRK